jgi:glycosyltransferase involved in cell wall biosynthesis
MHLAYVCGNPTYSIDSPSGYGTRMREICRGFERIGWTTSIHLPAGAERRIAAASTPRRKIFKSVVPRFAWETMRDVARLNSDLRFARALPTEFGSKPDVIYECLEFPGSISGRLKKFSRARHILEVHCPLEEEARIFMGQRPLQFLFSHRAREAIRSADGAIVISSVVKDWMISEGAKEERILVLPNGADLEKFDPKKFSSARASAPVIGYIGSDLSWHRLDALIDAFAALPREFNAQLEIVGIASENRNLKNRVATHNLEDRIVFVGSLPHEKIPERISSFDICVMAGSNRYGSPIKIFEYGAMGKAIVAPDEIPVREVMSDGVDGLLIPSGDVTSIRDALLRLLSDASLRHRLALSFQKKVRTQYGWNHIAERIATFVMA